MRTEIWSSASSSALHGRWGVGWAERERERDRTLILPFVECFRVSKAPSSPHVLFYLPNSSGSSFYSFHPHFADTNWCSERLCGFNVTGNSFSHSPASQLLCSHVRLCHQSQAFLFGTLVGRRNFLPFQAPCSVIQQSASLFLHAPPTTSSHPGKHKE
jgi:hypothetical protein